MLGFTIWHGKIINGQVTNMGRRLSRTPAPQELSGGLISPRGHGTWHDFISDGREREIATLTPELVARLHFDTSALARTASIRAFPQHRLPRGSEAARGSTRTLSGSWTTATVMALSLMCGSSVRAFVECTCCAH